MLTNFMGVQDEKAKGQKRELDPIIIYKDASLAIETSTLEVVCINNYYEAHEIAS